MKNDLDKILLAGLRAIGVDCKADQRARLITFSELIFKWNRVYNLTAIRSVDKMITHHLLDSIAVVPYINGQRIVDIGAGAGLPGIPLAIAMPEKQFTLVDSNTKKTRFMQQVKAELALDNIDVVHSRIEQFQSEKLFDTVISRAFATLGKIAKLSGHLCADNGLILAMKGIYPEEELKDAAKSLEIKAVHRLNVPGIDAERHLVVIKYTNSPNLN